MIKVNTVHHKFNQYIIAKDLKEEHPELYYNIIYYGVESELLTPDLYGYVVNFKSKTEWVPEWLHELLNLLPLSVVARESSIAIILDKP